MNAMNVPESETRREEEISSRLLAWYAAEARDLPWRRTRDPYRIWVSEVMLQQTRVDTVIPYYDRWMQAFPTLPKLADAPESEVLRLWEGLGYYSRARNLHQAAREVLERYGGVVPASPEPFRDLPGVGDYTAGAVQSIAFGHPVPAVDGNVLRVISRLYAIAEDVRRPDTRRQITDIVTRLIPVSGASAFNQSLMELGATVCTPRQPDCLICPVADACIARRQGIQRSLPVVTRKTAVRDVAVHAVFVQLQGNTLVHRRANKGLLAGLWELPSVECSPDEETSPEQLAKLLEERFGHTFSVGGILDRAEHAFSHLRWQVTLYGADVSLSQRSLEEARLHFADPGEIQSLAFPAVYRKLLDAMAPAPEGR